MKLGVLMSTRHRQLSLAIKLVDKKSGDILKNDGRQVKMPAMKAEPLKHIDGYFLYIKLKPGTYALTATADKYKETSATVDTIALDPKNPVYVMEMEKETT